MNLATYINIQTDRITTFQLALQCLQNLLISYSTKSTFSLVKATNIYITYLWLWISTGICCKTENKTGVDIKGFLTLFLVRFIPIHCKMPDDSLLTAFVQSYNMQLRVCMYVYHVVISLHVNLRQFIWKVTLMHNEIYLCNIFVL